MVQIKATIYFDQSFWVGLFERTDKKGYSVARQVFGGEPSHVEIYDFVLKNYKDLNFGIPQEFQLKIKRQNPKRIQREVRRETNLIKETAKPSTQVQDYMRKEIEKNKLAKKKRTKAEIEQRKDEQFHLRQQKKKEKQRGR